MEEAPVILFDGICNLCNAAVQYVIRHDPTGRFRFASLQSERGKKLLEQYGLAFGDLNSFVLIQNSRAFTRSTAALKVARSLEGITRALYGFIIVPPFIRNAVYDLVAKHRYRWFGKKDVCMVPTASLEARFLK